MSKINFNEQQIQQLELINERDRYLVKNGGCQRKGIKLVIKIGFTE